MRSFKDFILSKSSLIKEADENKDWKKQFLKLEKGFVPPSKLKPVVEAFLNSSSIKIMDDTSKEITMPKKTLYLTGGSVRDFLRNKTPKNFNLSTDATPEQTASILNSAGFKMESDSYDMDLSFKPEIASENDKKTWTSGQSDDSGKVVSIKASVDGEDFDIFTLKKEDGSFTSNILDDSKNRDLTINAMYIELSKSDGENNKLYDPTKHGWYDIVQGNIKSIGNPESKIKEDSIRMMRAMRFYSQFDKAKLDESLEKAIEKLKDEIKNVPLSKVREEFLKGLMDPEVDPKRYLRIYGKTKLLQKIFPEVDINYNVPEILRNKKDKILSLSWMLQNNPLEKVQEVLSSKREDQETGWSNQEKNAVVYLLKLKEFDVNDIDDLIEQRKMTGLSEDQIKNWVDMFDVDGKSSRPQWARLVRSFARFSPDSSKLLHWNSDEFADASPVMKPQIIKHINKEKLKDMFRKNM